MAYDVESRPTAITYTSAQTKDPELARIGQVKYVPAEGAEKGVLHLKDEVEPQAVLVEYTVPAPPTPLTEAPSQRKLTYSYDGLSRVTERKLFPTADASIPALRTYYSYESGGHGGSSTTGLVGSISVGDRQTVYYYDDVGNIVCENNFHYSALSESQLSFCDHGGNRLPLTFAGQPLITERKCREYEYDKLGQLIRADDGPASESWTYEYDQGGNIVRKLRYAYEGSQLGLLQKGKRGDLLETVEYTYGDPNWKDKLTAYNGKPIEYDAIGNPVKYDGKSFRWRAGRMLSEILNESGHMIFQFGYDHTGMRTTKWKAGRRVDYTYNEKTMTHMIITGANPAQMHFFYDAQGRPSIIRYNGIDYAYMHNLQGDVIGIVDMDGKAVVEYTYDAWGKPLSKTGVLASTLGTDNPFRYRGYVWDEETGLYYLRSRYYNPEWGRLLNADTLLGKAGGVLSHNTFAYCDNNPVNMRDPAGSFPLLALVVAVVIPTVAVVIAPIMEKRDDYNNAVLAADVTENSKYLKLDNNGIPQCNTFAYDVMWALGARLPRQDNGDAGTVRTMYAGLTRGNGFETRGGKWVEISGSCALQSAWLHAQLGIPTISIWRSKDNADRGGEGHIQVAFPGDSFDTSWAQAGGGHYGNYPAGPHMSRQNPDEHAGTYGGTYRYYYFEFN